MNKDFHPKTFPLLNIHRGKSLPSSEAWEHGIVHMDTIPLESINNGRYENSIDISDIKCEEATTLLKKGTVCENLVADISSNIEFNPAIEQEALYQANESPATTGNEIGKRNICSTYQNQLTVQSDIITDVRADSVENECVEAHKNDSSSSVANETVLADVGHVTKSTEDSITSNAGVRTPKFTRLSRSRNGMNKKSPVFEVDNRKSYTHQKDIYPFPDHSAESAINKIIPETSITLEKSGCEIIPPTEADDTTVVKQQHLNNVCDVVGLKEQEIIDANFSEASGQITRNAKDDCIDISDVLHGNTGPFLQKVSEHSFMESVCKTSFSLPHFQDKENCKEDKHTTDKQTKKISKKQKRKNCDIQLISHKLKKSAEAVTADDCSKLSFEKHFNVDTVSESKNSKLICQSLKNISKPTVDLCCSEKRKLHENTKEPVRQNSPCDRDFHENFKKDTEKTKVIKRICLTLEEIVSSFQESAECGRCEISTVPLPFSDFKLQLTVSEETLNVSILKVMKNQSTEICGEHDCSYVMQPEKSNEENQNKIQMPNVAINDITSSFPLNHMSTDNSITMENLISSSRDSEKSNHLCDDLYRETFERDESKKLSKSPSNKIAADGKRFLDCENEMEADPFNFPIEGNKADKIQERNDELKSVSDNSQLSADVDIFKDIEDPTSQITVMEKSSKYKTNIYSCLTAAEQGKEDENSTFIACLEKNSQLDCMSGQNELFISDDADHSKKVEGLGNLKENADCIECSFEESRNSLDVNLWPNLSASEHEARTLSQKNVNEIQVESNADCPVKKVCTEITSKTANVGEKSNSSDFGKRMSQPDSQTTNKCTVTDCTEELLSEEIDPFGDTCEIYKGASTQRESHRKFEEIIKESESYSSDPDMLFAADLVAPLKDIAKKMKNSSIAASGDVNNYSTKKKQKTIKSFMVLNDKTDRAKSRGNKVKGNKKFKRISQAFSSDSSDEMDAITQPYPEKSSLHEYEDNKSSHCDSNVKSYDNVNFLRNRASSLTMEDGEDETDASLKCSTVDSDIPSDAASRVKKEIELMNEKLGLLQRAIDQSHDSDCSSSDDSNEGFQSSVKSKTYDLCPKDAEDFHVPENEESSDLDLFSEQIPPTPPKHDTDYPNKEPILKD